MMPNPSPVELPSRVSVDVRTLERLHEIAAMFQSLKWAGLEETELYERADWIYETDPHIQSIRLRESDILEIEHKPRKES
jgi:hypothetical protein